MGAAPSAWNSSGWAISVRTHGVKYNNGAGVPFYRYTERKTRHTKGQGRNQAHKGKPGHCTLEGRITLKAGVRSLWQRDFVCKYQNLENRAALHQQWLWLSHWKSLLSQACPEGKKLVPRPHWTTARTKVRATAAAPCLGAPHRCAGVQRSGWWQVLLVSHLEITFFSEHVNQSNLHHDWPGRNARATQHLQRPYKAVDRGRGAQHLPDTSPSAGISAAAWVTPRNYGVLLHLPVTCQRKLLHQRFRCTGCCCTPQPWLALTTLQTSRSDPARLGDIFSCL